MASNKEYYDKHQKLPSLVVGIDIVEGCQNRILWLQAQLDFPFLGLSILSFLLLSQDHQVSLLYLLLVSLHFQWLNTLLCEWLIFSCTFCLFVAFFDLSVQFWGNYCELESTVLHHRYLPPALAEHHVLLVKYIKLLDTGLFYVSEGGLQLQPQVEESVFDEPVNVVNQLGSLLARVLCHLQQGEHVSGKQLQFIFQSRLGGEQHVIDVGSGFLYNPTQVLYLSWLQSFILDVAQLHP